MEFFKKVTTIDFMAIRKWTACLSSVLIIASLISLMVNGLNFGLDFTGGTQIQVAYKTPANLPAIRKTLEKGGFTDAKVQRFGATTNALIRIGIRKGVTQQELTKQVLAGLPGAKMLQSSYIGPQVGKQLATNGALALLISLIATALYIMLRFEYRFAISSAVALLHDPILVLGLFSYFHIEFDLISLAAVLTVIGYSLNDTIVVFDRIRENFRTVRRSTPTEIINLSVNQTLSRTVMTSALTLLVVVVLFFFGGPTLHGFSLAMIIGIVIGTYSSIYVAGALAVALGLKREDFLPTPKEALDERP